MSEASNAWHAYQDAGRIKGDAIWCAARDAFMDGFAAGQASRTPGPATARVLDIYRAIMRHDKRIDVPWATIDDVRAFLAEWSEPKEPAS